MDSTQLPEFPPHSERKGPQHRVYVVEVERLSTTVPFDLYVGSTHLYLRERWERYERLHKVSWYFRYGHAKALHYRYDLMDGWGPYMTEAEALSAEGELAYSLQQAGYDVYSDRLQYATGSTKYISAS